MKTLPESFKLFSHYDHFVVYTIFSDPKRPGKTIKKPICPFSKRDIDGQDSKNWMNFEAASDHVQTLGKGFGVGYVVTDDDPFWFLDIDNCYNPETKEWSPIASELYTKLTGAAFEMSSSGKGCHIIGSGTIPSHKCRNKEHGLEFYSGKRFIALTGISASGCLSFDASEILPEIINSYFPPGRFGNDVGEEWWTTEPHEECSTYEDDEALIKVMMREPGFGAPSFSELFHADQSVLEKAFAETNDAGGTQEFGYDRSFADISLAQKLAFYTGNNAERIERIMLQSALKRDKWDTLRKGGSFLRYQIRRACGKQTKFYNKDFYTKKEDVANQEDASEEILIPKDPTGKTYLDRNDLKHYFKNCAYLMAENKIIIHNGTMLDRVRFNAAKGGKLFCIDDFGDKNKYTDDAWKAFVNNPIIDTSHQKANIGCFMPNKKFGEKIHSEGLEMINTYYDLKLPRKKGDVSIFRNHISKLLPNERDQDILLSYMAALVQHKGEKFTWCPFIQGIEGNGKSLLSMCLVQCIGTRYYHAPRTKTLLTNFNGWMRNKIFCSIEDMYLEGEKTELFEIMKPLLEQQFLEIEAKGIDQCLVPICINFFITANKKNSYVKTESERRIAPFFTDQQTVEDLIRCGMDEDYFIALHDWLLYENGFAIVHEFLATYAINPKFNPAKRGRCPVTSSTHEAVNAGYGLVENTILEAIERGDTCGLKFPWVSDKQLENLLEAKRLDKRVSGPRRVDMMKTIGYILHPALGKDGRPNNPVMPDACRTKLYVHKSHPDFHLKTAAEASRAYTASQQEI